MAKSRGALTICLFYVLGFGLLLIGGLLVGLWKMGGEAAVILGIVLIGAAMILGPVMNDNEPPRIAGGVL